MNSEKQNRPENHFIKRKNRKSGVLITLPLKTRVKCITVLLYIRVLNRCLSAPPPPAPGCPIPTNKPTGLFNFSNLLFRLLFLKTYSSVWIYLMTLMLFSPFFNLFPWFSFLKTHPCRHLPRTDLLSNRFFPDLWCQLLMQKPMGGWSVGWLVGGVD